MTTLFHPRYRNYLFLAPLFAVALFCQLFYIYTRVNDQIHYRSVPAMPFSVDEDDGRVSDPRDMGAKAGLHKGDKVMMLEGRAVQGEDAIEDEMQRRHAGDMIHVTVVPAGSQTARTLELPLRSMNDAPSVGEWLGTVALLAMRLFCLAVGIYVAAVRPRDPRALIFFALMVSFSEIVSMSGSVWPHAIRPLMMGYQTLAQLSACAWAALFGVYFPERPAWDLRLPWLKWLLIAPLFAFSVFATVWLLVNHRSFEASASLTPWVERLQTTPVPILNILAICLFFASLAAKIATASTRDAKRRLILLWLASFFGLVPTLAVLAYTALRSTPPEYVRLPAFLLLFLMPITMAYGIVVGRAIDVRMAVRQGVRYTLARGALQIAIRLLGGGLFFWLAIGFFDSKAGMQVGTEIRIAAYGILVILISMGARHVRSRVLTWVDQRFFREAYKSEQILADLSEKVRGMMEEQALLETVMKSISEALHIPRIAILMRGGSSFQPAYAFGYGGMPAAALPASSQALAEIRASKDPPRIYFDDTENWIYRTPETEVNTLKELGSELLLTVGPKERPIGLLSLGPKLSEEPYSKSDIQLLQSVVLQTGLALENTRLAKSITLEISKRERLSREIEIAREVQERLFPQELPKMPGLDYCGACRPAQGVGGDYYDFVPLADGNLGIAIGDVSGKGIAAALLMATLQASLRGQTIDGGSDLARIMTNVNRLVFDASASNRYATFFYAQYDRHTSRLTYVNAGHNPPFILRKTGGGLEVIRLETGGPVIGLFRLAPYQQDCITLEPGDVMIGFTDGVSEAMNPDDEEWGEERMLPAIEECLARSAAEMIPIVMAAADQFVNGAPQHDDMTLVVVKLA